MHRFRLVLFEVAVLLSLPGAALLAQTGTIRGTVSDSATQGPLEGAQVSIVGGTARTQTNQGGGYVLAKVAPGTARVRVQLIGYAPAEQDVTVAADGEATADFVLVPGVAKLEEVVAVGYGTQTRAELSTSVASVSGADLVGQPIASVDAALQGKAPGVQVVQNAGNPGNAISVRVRGLASISASNDPLYVVDGVPMIAGDLSQLDVGGQNVAAISTLSLDDVESIDVLKDAAASAIYGSRGSNGVVLITTKRGQVGRTTVNFNSYVGTQSAARRLHLLNAQQYLEYFNESAVNDGYGENFYGVAGVDDQTGGDWQNGVLRSAPVSNAELSVSGGDERLRYRLSGTWFDQNGIVINSGYRRAGGRLNLDFNPNNRLSFSTSLSFSGDHDDRIENDGSDKGIITDAVGDSPMIPIRDAAGDFTGPPDLEYPNPVALATLNDVRARTNTLIGNLEARLRVTDRLLFTSRFGLDNVNLREDQFESRLVTGTYASSSDGVAKSGYTQANRYVIDNFATLSPNLGERSDLTVTAGNSLEFNRSEFNFIRGEGFSSDRFTQVSNAAVLILGQATNSKSNLASFFARGEYTLDRKYGVGVSFRTDGSSRFGPNNRWGFFPAVSGSWLLSEEPFMKGKFFDYFKLRASYGRTGNQAISDYPWQGLYGSANYGDTPGSGPSNLANPNLKWESTRQFDAGLDMTFARGRVSVTADYYHKLTKDLLLARPISGTSGFTTVFDNVGNVRNKGFELALTTVNIDSRRPEGFRWSTPLNLGINRNKVTALFNGQPFTGGERDINRIEVGQPIGAFYTLHFLGVDPATGDAIYEDVNGDGSITSDDRTIVGSPHPDYTGGLTSTVSYKRFDLTGFLVFSHGAQVFNAMRIFSDAGGWYLDNQFTDVLRRWRQPGDQTDQPRASYDGVSGAAEISSRYIENGSYWRMQDLTLGYRLPDHWAGALGFASARFYGSVRNLFTITDYSGYSPDVNSNGADNNATGISDLGTASGFALGTDFYAYPLARTFTFGVQASW
ncbi:MAG TPA: TonB-dependent receptor [Gemmatimonadales bacterium]|nr:TonB-dependent receptor [Gemmatimonadales bacterium]